MRKVHVMAAAGALTAALAMAGGASAQIAPRSNAPLEIAADQQDILTQECKSIWSGDVEAMQARTRLRTRLLTAYSTKKGDECGETERLVAEGDVFYVEQDRTIRAQQAVYTARGETIVLTGDVIVVQGKSVARAERVTIDLATGRSQMYAGSKGRGSKNRVRGVFYPSGKSE